MAQDWKDRLGVVFSTNSDFKFDNEEKEKQEEIPFSKQHLKIRLDTKRRKGKKVTLISGYKGSDESLKELGKKLKSKCGAGGAVKDGEILIQGDFREKAAAFLKEQGAKITMCK